MPFADGKGYIPDQLKAYIEPRLFETMDAEALLWGDARTAVRQMGFEVFFGGVCHSIMESQQQYYNKDV